MNSKQTFFIFFDRLLEDKIIASYISPHLHEIIHEVNASLTT
jgi:hypothetical protein